VLHEFMLQAAHICSWGPAWSSDMCAVSEVPATQMREAVRWQEKAVHLRT